MMHLGEHGEAAATTCRRPVRRGGAGSHGRHPSRGADCDVPRARDESLARMVSLVLGMLACVALALAVMALVAVPARRAGREVLTERGEEVLGSIRDRQLLPGRSARADDEHDAAPRTRSPWAPAPDPPSRRRRCSPGARASVRCGSMGQSPRQRSHLP